MKHYLRYLLLPSMVVIFLVTVSLAQAAVELVSFDAIPVVAVPKITLIWETASELDFAGFYIQHSLNPDTGFERLADENGDSKFFYAQGEGGTGSDYIYDDFDVVINVLHFYMLEMIDIGGGSTFSDVVSVFLGNTPTPTPTPTPTSSLTFTPTATQGTLVPTDTRTPTQPTPTRTMTPQPTLTVTRTPTRFRVVTFTARPRSTSTPTETPTTTSTPTISPTVTTTLAPLPSLTLLFPIRTPTPTQTYTPSPTRTSSPVPPTPTPTPKPDNFIPLQLSFLGGIIILLWISLAGFLLAYLRRLSR